ncbi:CRE-CLEC-61 protein [Caenorhabditis remanei]|uniref:CRE-CLEC-61 protein n=1 Tax=Caenorhabditis remanei TaxID=31234 RepID=E3LFS1_CAERE|nr:CRE-CLEC-61 protein [Caenorhabditis remanei]
MNPDLLSVNSHFFNMTCNSFLLCFLVAVACKCSWETRKRNAMFLVTVCLGGPVSRASNCKDSYVDRVCGEDQTNLWLDIVFVVDNSEGMTNAGITSVSDGGIYELKETGNVAAQISSLFVAGQQLGIQSNNPRTTRVGIITYNQGATVAADLNKFTSVDDLTDGVFNVLNKVSNVQDSYLHAGLQAANDLLEQQSFNTDRGHYQKLVIVYASEYKQSGTQDPLPLAIRMQQTISISTVAYGQDDNLGFLAELSKIATPGYNFTNQQGENTVSELRSTMLQVNCYCPNGWFQMRQSYANENSFKYGVCLLPVTLQATWTASKFSCRNHWNKAYLVNEYTQTKHDYVLQIVRNTSAFTQPYTYFNGLSYVSGNWQWEQPDGQDPIIVSFFHYVFCINIAIQLQNWSDWNPGYPTASSTATVGVNVQTSSSSLTTGWQNTRKDLTNMYICEVSTCDSTNYCKAEDI